MNLASLLQQTFDAVNERDVDGALKNWSATATYDNPLIGLPVTGTAELRRVLAQLIEKFRSAGIRICVDRTTYQDNRVIAEWHLEPRDGRTGVHVAEFDSQGKLAKVTVYPRR